MVSEGSSFPVPFKRTQFHVLGTYYLAINRAQGQTLLHGGMFLDRSALSRGHLYMVFGRCGCDPPLFVYANQSEFENFRENLDDTKLYTVQYYAHDCHTYLYPELMEIGVV